MILLIPAMDAMIRNLELSVALSHSLPVLDQARKVDRELGENETREIVKANGGTTKASYQSRQQQQQQR